jgi:hypothetical protein
MRTPAMPSATFSSVLDDFCGRLGSAWRETDAKAPIRDLLDIQ